MTGRAGAVIGVVGGAVMTVGIGLASYAPADVPGLMAALDAVGSVLGIVGGLVGVAGAINALETPWNCKHCKKLNTTIQNKNAKIAELEEILVSDGKVVTREVEVEVVKYLPRPEKPKKRRR